MGADCSTVVKCTGSDSSLIKPMEAAPAAATYPKAKRAKSKEGVPQRSDSKEGTPGKEEKEVRAERKIDKIRVEKNFKRLRKLALETAGEITHFSVFVKRNFGLLDKAFDALAGKSRAQVDLQTFVIHAEKAGFSGNSERVFYGLCDDRTWDKGAIVTRGAFAKRVSSLGTPFRNVVLQAFARNRDKIKKKVTQRLKEQNRDQDLIDEFRQYIEPRFPTPGKAFDAIAGDDGRIDEEEFVEWLSSTGFPGDAVKAFDSFCDADGYITRVAFSEILVSNPESIPEGDAMSPGTQLKRAGTIMWHAPKDAPVEEECEAPVGNPQEPTETSDQKEERRRSKESAVSEEALTKERPTKRRSTSKSVPGGASIKERASGRRSTSKLVSEEKSAEKNSADDAEGNDDNTTAPKATKSRRASSKEKLVETSSPDDKDAQDDGNIVSRGSRRRSTSRSVSKEKVSVEESDKNETKSKKKLRRASKSSLNESDSPADKDDSCGDKMEGDKPSSEKKKSSDKKRRNSI